MKIKPFADGIRAGALVLLAAGIVVGAGRSAAAAADAASPAGRWDATVVVNGAEIPFRFEVAGSGADVKGSFFDGEQKVTSTAGKFENGTLTFAYAQYASTLELTLKDGALEGEYARGSRPPYPITAKRYVAPAKPAGEVPSIDGVWKIGIESSKGEAAWRFIVRQNGPDVSAGILRVDGDTGTLTGRYQDGKFVLSHFSGARPSRWDVTLQSDGTLEILQNGKTARKAVRFDGPKSTEVADPTDPTKHTRAKDPNAKFQFSFPDLKGQTVSDTDARFQNKVVIVSITGSWCPNCRDEAPFLAKLYKKYRGKGLEVVAFSFEEEEQLKDPTRLKAFIKEFGIDYTVLLAGVPDQLNEKVPQGENLNAIPTTFFLGRDGKVKAVHAGFPSGASGKFYTDAAHDFTELVERLLAERSATNEN
jgi:thiol-disulfide isomerase/thioredoxin